MDPTLPIMDKTHDSPLCRTGVRGRVDPFQNSSSLNFLLVHVPILSGSRSTSFFTKYSAEALWKSVTSVSNAGRQRGRGKGAWKLMRNLNAGQYIGIGKINMLWPGLSGPIMHGRTVMKHQRLPDDGEREAKLIKKRDSVFTQKSKRVHPLERGWTSAKIGGKSLGPPDPIND
ncbi:hypothetical protein QAD02_020399, partial [Eretmocerus hayati]